MEEAPPGAGRPTWAEIDLDAIVENYSTLLSLQACRSGRLIPGATPPVSGLLEGLRPRLIPVVKADAYGHGAVPVARALAECGAGCLAVALVEEGALIREAGLTVDILVLEGAWPGQEPEVIRQRLIPAVQSPAEIERLNRVALESKRMLPVHLKVDTGMVRMGVWWENPGPVLTALADAGSICLAGTFSHLADSDGEDHAFTREQMRRYFSFVDRLVAARLDPGELHLANSAGLLIHPETRCLSARPGIALYGYGGTGDSRPVRLHPSLSLKSRIRRIQWIPPGTPVGYNRRFVAQRRTLTGTVPIGYADGYRRSLSGKGRVIVRRRWAEVLGAVSMDLMVVDLTDVPDAAEGDEVTLLGESADLRVDASDWARQAGTIPYEILCGITSRVARRYVRSRT